MLQARYYDSSKGAFLSEDPTFWGNQNLIDPQSLNSYNYANDNPISRSDPNGLFTLTGTGKAILSQLKAQLQGALATIQQIRSGQFASNVASGAGVVRSNPMGVAGALASGIKQNVIQTYRDLYYGNDATQDQALASSVLFFGSLAIPDSEAAQLAARARQVNGVLDPIAQSMRTAAVLRTSAGDIVAGGGRDLTAGQIASLNAGEIAATPMPGAQK